MSIFEEMMKSYADSHKTNTASSTKKYDLKNYFSTYLPADENEGTKEIRILPPEEGKNTFWTVLWGHKAQVDGDWKTFPCLKHEEGKPCPFCEANEVLRASGDEENKKLAKTYSARKMYVLKVIERGKENEGPKFWRFNHAYDKQGTLDKIMGAVKIAKHDITDPNTGRDLILNITRNQFNVPVVLSVNNSLQQTKLSEDEGKVAEWLSDNRTWRDVYSLRNYDYLRLVVRGKVPVWSKEEERWVAKTDEVATDVSNAAPEKDTEITMGGAQPAQETPTQPPVPTVEVPSTPAPSAEQEEDELPF